MLVGRYWVCREPSGEISVQGESGALGQGSQGGRVAKGEL